MKFKILFITVILLASILRLWDLANHPAGFNADEASIGYNAYSLLKTGHDEYGISWPITFKSFGDYKPGLYFYVVLHFVRALGLNELAIRLPSAILGIASVALIFFLAKEITGNKNLSLLASLLLAISPWHLHFSRGGWETNAATFFIMLGVYLFLISFKKPHLILVSLISFLASMYTYQSPRLVVPVLLLFLGIVYMKQLKRIILRLKSWSIVYGIVLMLLAIPLAAQFTGQSGTARFEGLSFLSDTGPYLRINELRGEHQSPNGILATVFHNKITTLLPVFLGHYLDHFKPDFLFITGDSIIRNRVPETGQFFVIEALFMILGLVFLVRRKFEYSRLLIGWILIAPLASSLTYQTPHALRALNMVIPLTILVGIGFYYSFNAVKNLKIKSVALCLVSLLLVFETFHYLESYYVHYPKRYPLAWEYGFKEMVGKLNELEPYYNNVVITDRYDQPYVLVLFYKQYNPSKYQPQAVLSLRDKFNFGTVRSFDKYHFRKIDPSEQSSSTDTLFISTKEEAPKNVKILDRVYFPNGEEAFVFWESKKS